MERKQGLSEEQLDYLTELINVGAGNAAGALEQLVGCKVEMRKSEIHFAGVGELRSIFDDPSRQFAAVNMELRGEIRGDMIFMMDSGHLTELLDIMKSGGGICSLPYDFVEVDVSVIEELGNILAGVYLNAIQEMSGLIIYHIVPDLRTGRADDLLYDYIYRKYVQMQRVTLIENRLIIEKKSTMLFFLLLSPSPRSLDVLVDTLKSHELAE